MPLKGFLIKKLESNKVHRRQLQAFFSSKNLLKDKNINLIHNVF